MVVGTVGHGGQHQDDRCALGGETQHLVFGDVLGLLVVAVEMAEVGDVVLGRGRPRLGAPEPQCRHCRGVDNALDAGFRSFGDDVATALDIHGVERRRVHGPETEFGCEMEAESSSVKGTLQVLGFGDVHGVAFDLEPIEVGARGTGFEHRHHLGFALEQGARHRGTNEPGRPRHHDTVAGA